MTDSRSGFTDSLILRELQNIHEALTKTKEEHTLNFRMIKPTEKFNFSEPILNTTKLGLIRLSVYNSVFNVSRRNNQFLYSNSNINKAITPGAFELTEIAELIKEETDSNVIIEPDKNTMKCLMEIKQGAICFDVENSIASLLGFRKAVINKVNIHFRKLLILWVLVLLTFIVM